MLKFLAQEGVGVDQPVTFLSDGGDTVRRALTDFDVYGERALDWFHVTIRVHNIEKMIKELLDSDDRPVAGVLINELRSAKCPLARQPASRHCSGLKA